MEDLSVMGQAAKRIAKYDVASQRLRNARDAKMCSAALHLKN
jgi:hypothetical protein